MVPLALWNNNVPANERRAIADRLLAVKPAFSLPSPQNTFGSGFGKSKFQGDITLADLVANIFKVEITFSTKKVHDMLLLVIVSKIRVQKGIFQIWKSP